MTLGGPAVAYGSIYEFYWVSSLLVSVGVLLFVVIVCVVALIDFSEGAIRVRILPLALVPHSGMVNVDFD